MSTIVTRAGKGSALTHTEADANFINLENDKLENVVEDTTPQLGGALDAQSNQINNLAEPTTDQDAATKIYVDNSVAGAAVTSSSKTIIEARNASGASIAKGVPVYLAGNSGNKILIAPADANDPAKMPAIGLIDATTANNTDCDVVSFGDMQGINTATLGSVGDTLYIDTTPGGATFGGLTTTAPTGETSLIQNIGKIARSDSNGQIVVSGPGRTNATPNLDEDQFFLGNASNQSVATDFSDAVQAISINYTDLSATTAAPDVAGLTYNNTTGEFTFTPEDISDLTSLTDFSVTVGAASGAGNLSYDNLTGEFTFNPADASDLISLGDLSATTAAAGTASLTYNNVTGVFTFTPEDTSDLLGFTDLSATTAAPGTAGLTYNNVTGEFVFTPEDISDLAALDDFSVTTGAASGAGALSYNNVTGVFTFNPVDTSLVLSNVVEDTTPQLGGDLDVNDNIITSSIGDVAIEATGSNNVAIDTASGNINLATNSGFGVTLSYLKSYEELIRTNNSTTGTITLDHLAAPIDYIVQTGNITITGLDQPVAGASVTLILNNSGGSYTVSFAETNSTFYGLDGLDPTLTGFDMISMLCIDDTTDGEVYIVTHVGDFASI